jgi:hypothetical protein
LEELNKINKNIYKIHNMDFLKKHINYIIIAVFFFCIATISCTKEDTPHQNIKTKTEVAAFANLHNQLIDYNKSFGISETRGFWKKLWGIFKADAIGAVLGCVGGGFSGALLGATSASSAKALTFTFRTPLSPIGRPISFNCLDCVDRIDSLGIWHNEILMDLYQQDSTLFELANEDSLFLAIKIKAQERYPHIDFTDIDVNFMLDVAHTAGELSESESMVTAIGRKVEFYKYDISAELSVLDVLFPGIAQIED